MNIANFKKLKSHSVYRTTNYSLFVKDDKNREVQPCNLVKTRKSMKKYGWLKSLPMIVYRTKSGVLVIRDGQHRFQIAVALGIPVWFSIEDVEFDTADIQTGRPWTNSDYLEEYVKKDIIDYWELQEYCIQYKITLIVALTLFNGQCTNNSKLTKDFQQGDFKIKDSITPYKIGDLTALMKSLGIGTYNHTLLIKAISRCLLLDEFSLDQFRKKVAAHSSLLNKKCATLDEFLDLVEFVYNRQSAKKDKVDIAYLVKKKMEERSICKSVA